MIQNLHTTTEQAALPNPQANSTYLWDLLRILVQRDLKLRYKRSLLGMLWSLVNPLSQLVIFTFVFNVILPTGIENFAVFLFIGLLVWEWFQGSIVHATSSIISNGMMIRRPGFPTAILPVVTVTTHLLHFFLAIPILALFLLVNKTVITSAILWLPLILVVQFILILSISYYVAAIHVRFRDTQYLVTIFLMFGFYLSPIFYDASLVPESLAFYYNLNPMVHIISAYRDVLLYATMPNLSTLFSLLIFSIFGLWFGFSVFRDASYQFVEEI